MNFEIFYREHLKRGLDFSAATLGFILLSPVFLTMTALLFAANRGKPFFVQPRPGKNGNIFNLVKFRTMTNQKDNDGNLLPDADRLTTIGKIVRKTSLDEIPQLLNVIRGDMSLVGPRPLLVEYLPLYDKEQIRRHDVRPGITGWAQINGRNEIDWITRFDYDLWYVDNVSFSLDIEILLLTVKRVVKSDGISSQGAATMEKFRGNH